MPSEAALRDFYSCNYRRSYKYSTRPRRRDLLRDQQRAEERLKLLDPLLKPGARLLDFGSGSGMFLLLANKYGLEVEGLEPDSVYSEQLRRHAGLTVHSDTWEAIDFAPGSFDIVVCHHVLEHLRQPSAALARMFEWTKPDAHLYLSVPDLKNPNSSPLNRFHYAHIYGFTPESLEMIALKMGFSRVAFSGTGGTTLIFRRLSTPPADWFLYPNHGSEMVAFYRRYSMKNYLLSSKAYTRYFRHAADRIFGRR